MGLMQEKKERQLLEMDQSMSDYKDSQIAKLELEVMKLKNELNKMQGNDQLLRDENDDLKAELTHIQSLKKNKLQFMDNKLLKRASMIHDTLKQRNTLNLVDLNDKEKEENDKMIDELSLQIESLEEERSELKYQITAKNEELQTMQRISKEDKAQIIKMQQQILEYKTNYILVSESDRLQNELMETLKEREARIAEYEAELKENLFDSTKIKSIREAYEAQIKHLEHQLNESKDIITKQHQSQALQTKKPYVSNKHIMSYKDRTAKNKVSNDSVSDLQEQIRALKLENARIKSSKFNK